MPFGNYELVNLKELSDNTFNEFISSNINNFIISKGVSQNVTLTVTDLSNNIYPIKKEEIEFVTANITYNLEYNSPINQTTYVGSIYISIGNILIDSCSIHFNCSIDKKDVSDYIYDILSLPKIFNI